MRKVCCITGHRDIPQDKSSYIKEQLEREIQLAIDDGFVVFISGFADGADLLFAETVLEFKKTENLFLEAALPYANRMTNGSAEVKKLLAQCDGIKPVCQEYSRDCYMLRNRYMVEQSQRVIAVYDGRPKGGTVTTMRFAHVMEREMRVIDL